MMNIKDLKAYVNAQSKNENLWFQPETVGECILQDALRDLHGIAESVCDAIEAQRDD